MFKVLAIFICKNIVKVSKWLCKSVQLFNINNACLKHCGSAREKQWNNIDKKKTAEEMSCLKKMR